MLTSSLTRVALLGLPPKSPEAEVALTLDVPCLHLRVYDSAPQTITLESDKFHAYLHVEGLDSVKTQRELVGTANQPTRERYRCHSKTLIEVGQRLELPPLRNPLALVPNDVLPIKILFDGKRGANDSSGRQRCRRRGLGQLLGQSAVSHTSKDRSKMIAL
jgi:hypothetical protein